MIRLSDLLPTAELVEGAPLVELSGCVLRVLAAEFPHRNGTNCLRNFLIDVGMEYGSRTAGTHKGVAQACAEAWEWLHVQGFICQHAEHDAGWMKISRKGKAVAGEADFSRWVAEQELPPAMLHEQLRGTALRLFQQGLLDNAVFEAFKTLEVAIRDAGQLGLDQVGVALASRAFHPESGPLTDMNGEKGERVALMNLMTGALGSYKNPHSHRRVEISAGEAREMLLLASHLLRIVDARAGLSGQPT